MQTHRVSAKSNQPLGGGHAARGHRAGVVLALVTLLLGAAAPHATAQANPPTKLTYQGFLTDQNGVPIGNAAPVNKSVIFRIYDAATGGTRLWSSQQTVTMDKGHFSVLLGEGSAVGSEPFNADLTGLFTDGDTVANRHLELMVDGATIAPRQQFLSAPYSLLARRAREVDVAGVPPLDSSKIAAGTLSSDRIPSLDANKINAGTLSVDRIPSLDANKISAGTLGDARLSANVALLGAAQTFTGTPSFNAGLNVNGSQVINFGADVADKQGDAGKIGYGTFDGGALCIVGAGTTGDNRRVKIWSEGGLNIGGVGGDIQITRTADTFSITAWNLSLSRDRWMGISFDGNNDVDWVSDVRLKTNIVDAESVLDNLLKVRFRRYNFKSAPTGAKTEFGVVAQELEPLFPDMVGELDQHQGEGPMKTVGYTSFGTITAKAVQELNARMEGEFSKLRTEIETLKAENKTLRTQVQAAAGTAKTADELLVLRQELQSLKKTVEGLVQLRASR